MIAPCTVVPKYMPRLVGSMNPSMEIMDWNGANHDQTQYKTMPINPN